MTEAELMYGSLAALMGFIFIFLGIALIGAIIQMIALWKVYKKAGKNGWESIIPVYNNYVLAEICGLNWWWFLFFFAPSVLAGIEELAFLGTIASLFVSFNFYYNLAKKFHKEVGFAIGLTLLPPVFIGILGFSKKCVYDASVAVSKNGVIGKPEVTNNVQQPMNPTMQPMGNVQQPMNPTMQPMGNAQQPMNPTIQPMGNVQQPMNQTMQPTGNAQQPMNPTIQPMGSVQQPVNPTMQPTGSVQQPVNPTMQPMSDVQQPTNQNTQQNQ